MSSKFNRKYKLVIETNDNQNTMIVVTEPMTIRFNIQRSCMASLNTAKIQIINLGEEKRNLIFHDRLAMFGVSAAQKRSKVDRNIC